ncbi:SMI1/KNR4 family protein [Burkholderiaceae bacterium DAT-1]|nr:SMI1/KNR4 family protein [Burkholderiaceae bacterium DAT-1]
MKDELLMQSAFGKIFIDAKQTEFGVIRESSKPHPIELAGMHVFAEDGCGNYFVQMANKIYFWDHETGDQILLADSPEVFLNGCKEPTDVDMLTVKVESAWIDPEFAKLFGVSLKS